MLCLPALVKIPINTPSPLLPQRGSSSIILCFELKTRNLAILEGEVLPLDLVKGAPQEVDFLLSNSHILSLHDFGAFFNI